MRSRGGYYSVTWTEARIVVALLHVSEAMSTADPEYMQVWQQVKQWPVELRQDLAQEIIKSVESDLPAPAGSWDEAKNARRCELIDREIQGTIGGSERRELEVLTRELRVYRRQIAPVPIERATKLHQQLLAKKRRHDGAAGA